MKIIHCADLHLNSALSSLPSDKAKTRREEILANFERLCDYAKNNQVKAVIIAGDLFDTSKVTNKVMGRVLYAISNCPNTDFLYLSGNHDNDLFLNVENLPSNFKMFTTDWTYFSYEDVVIAGVSFNSFNTLTVYDNLKLSNQTLNVVVMHGQIAGYKNTEPAEVISLPRLVGKNIDYLALGHVHFYADGKLDERGEYAYSGCLDARGFDETGDKGFVLLEVENGKFSKRFIPFATRSFVEFTYDVTDKTSPFYVQEEIFNTVTNQVNSNSAIKIVLKGQAIPELDLDLDSLNNRLNKYFFYAKIQDKTTLKINIEDYKYDKSLKGEFVRTVLSTPLTEEEKSQIVMCGLRALKGEDF
jgi:DNA repair exonuclease SbcCD nuclease subunit